MSNHCNQCGSIKNESAPMQMAKDLLETTFITRAVEEVWPLIDKQKLVADMLEQIVAGYNAYVDWRIKDKLRSLVEDDNSEFWPMAMGYVRQMLDKHAQATASEAMDGLFKSAAAKLVKDIRAAMAVKDEAVVTT